MPTDMRQQMLLVSFSVATHHQLLESLHVMLHFGQVQNLTLLCFLFTFKLVGLLEHRVRLKSSEINN